MLQCDHIEVRRGAFTLGPVTCEAPPAAITAVVGPNASGKTTLLHAAAGILAPTAGRVFCGGVNMVDMPTSARAASVVLLPQRPAADLPLAVERLVELGCLRREGGAAAALVAEAIERFGLEDLRDRPVASLSAGQAQRAHLARVWSQRSSNAVLVLDEPTAPLDHRWAGRVWAMLHEHAGAGGSVLVAVHDLAVAADAADEAWLLRDGTLAASGPGEAVLQPERLEEAFEAGFEWAPRGDGSRWLVPSTSSV